MPLSGGVGAVAYLRPPKMMSSHAGTLTRCFFEEDLGFSAAGVSVGASVASAVSAGSTCASGTSAASADSAAGECLPYSSGAGCAAGVWAAAWLV